MFESQQKTTIDMQLHGAENLGFPFDSVLFNVYTFGANKQLTHSFSA